MKSKVLKDLVIRLDHLKEHKKDIYSTIKNPNALLTGILKLDKIVGLESTKKRIVDFITSVIVSKSIGKFVPEENNIVITGPSGVGKSSIAYILGYIVNALGVIVWDEKTADHEEQAPDLISLLRNINTRKVTSSSSELDRIRKRNIAYQIEYQEISSLLYVLDERIKELVRRIPREDKDEIVRYVKDLSTSYTSSVIGRINSFDPIKHEMNRTEQVDEFESKYYHASKHDLIGTFVGSTPDKTKKLLQKVRGGVLFIDEAYSLVNINPTSGSYGNDFGNEALTEICNDITKYPGSMVIILAGYKDKIQENIFDVQEGLQRRFSIWIDIEGYDYQELYDIFTYMLDEAGFKVGNTEEVLNFFKKNEHRFNNYAGDCQSLVKQIKHLIYGIYFEDLTKDTPSGELKRSSSDTSMRSILYDIPLKVISDAFELVKIHDVNNKEETHEKQMMYI